jgi:hypothetical protein
MYRAGQRATSRLQDVVPIRSLRALLLTVAAGAVVVLANREVITYGVPATEVLVAPLAVVWVWLVLRDWRWGIWGMIAYLPFVGVPEIITYPNTTLPVLAKDILFVAPCYMSLGARLLTRRLRIHSNGLPWQLFLLFGALNVVELFNPSLSSKYVGLIGIKIWLLYIPLAFIVPLVIDSIKSLRTLLRAFVYLSAVPAALGLVEFLLIHAGKTDIVYRWYGKAASAMFYKGYFKLGGQAFLTRIPSTFPSPAQYEYFLLTSVACGFALLALERESKRVGLTWAIIGADCIAALTSGERGAFIYVLFLLALTALWTGGVKGLLRMIPTAVGSLGATVLLFGGAAAGLYSLISQVTVAYGQQIFTQQITQALQTAVLGLGPGMDSQAAGHYGGESASFAWLAEGWWSRVIYELGLPGLALIAGIWLVIVWRGWMIWRCLQDRALARVAACLVVYVIVMLYVSLKSTPLDQDPSNVYIWLVVGLLPCLPGIAAVASRPRLTGQARAISRDAWVGYRERA